MRRHRRPVRGAELTEILAGFTYNALFAAADVELGRRSGADETGCSRSSRRSTSPRVRCPRRMHDCGCSGTDALPPGQTAREPDRAMLALNCGLLPEIGRESADWAACDRSRLTSAEALPGREDTVTPGHVPVRAPAQSSPALLDPIPDRDAVRRRRGDLAQRRAPQRPREPACLAVRVVQDLGAADRSFVTHDLDEFRSSDMRRPSGCARFVEPQPDLLRFSHRGNPTLVLDIDVDLWEALMRMRSVTSQPRRSARLLVQPADVQGAGRVDAVTAAARSAALRRA